MSSSRYSRQVLLPEVGPEGQARLASANILCIGAGGLGSPALLYLAAAGVGRITLLDPDRVEESNLQRQVLYSQADLNELKVEVAQKKLLEMNPDLEIVAVPEAFSPENARRLAQGCQLIVDGSDNFETRFLANEVASQMSIPLVYAAVEGFQGQVGLFWAERGACYRCLQPKHPQAPLKNCELQGVLGSVVGTLGLFQAQLALQVLISGGEPSHPLYPQPGMLTLVDLSQVWSFSTVRVPRRPGCTSCTPNQKATSTFVSALELKRKLEGRENSPVLIDLRDPHSLKDQSIPGAISLSLESLEKGEWPAALEDLSQDSEIIVFCRQGVKSPLVVDLLDDRGFTRAQSLLGGFEAWSRVTGERAPEGAHTGHGP